MRTRRAHPSVLAAFLLACVVGVPLAAQSNETAAVRVRITDAATGLPIGGAQVGFPELALFSLANDAGIAQIVGIPPGSRTLEVTMLGYGKASTAMILEAHAVATGNIALTSDPIEIEGLTVTTSAEIERLRDAGFYNRERMGQGYQLGPLEIASTIALVPSDYFARIPSVEVVQGDATIGRKEVVSRRSCVTLSSLGIATPPEPARTGSFGGAGRGSASGFKPGAGPNAMAIYLDGVPYFDELDLLPAEMIQAAEIYVGNQVPVQYSNHPERAVCGVILLWSK
jgi:hypothetical protein